MHDNHKQEHSTLKPKFLNYEKGCHITHIVILNALHPRKISSLLNKINERKSEQAHIPHAPTLLENAVYNEWQFQALGMGNRTKKGI